MDSQDFAKLLQGWTAPEGLNRSIPREVRLTRSGIALVVLSVLLVLGGIAGAAALDRQGRRQAADARRMLAEGRETGGVVTRRWQTGGKSNQHRVAYRISVDGRSFDGRASISSGRWRRLEVGSAISIRYLGSDPAHNYPSDDPPHPSPSWDPLLIGALAAIPGVLFAWMVHRKQRLLEEGRPAPAIVVRIRKIRSNSGTTYIAHYQFPLADGATAKGHYNTGRRPEPEGSVICVLYDPDNPRRNGRYPMSLVKLSLP